MLLIATYDLTYGLSPQHHIVNQADHRAVGIATLDAARDAANRWIFPELVDEGFDPWPGVRHVYVMGSNQPGYAVDVTDTIDDGIESLKSHRVYLEGLGGGVESGCPRLPRLRRREPGALRRDVHRATRLRFGADETPIELHTAFAELREAVATVAGGRDVDTLTEVLWATVHGLTTLGRSDRLRPGRDAERIGLVVAQFHDASTQKR